jgi:hypothetical protein
VPRSSGPLRTLPPSRSRLPETSGTMTVKPLISMPNPMPILKRLRGAVEFLNIRNLCRSDVLLNASCPKSVRTSIVFVEVSVLFLSRRDSLNAR